MNTQNTPVHFSAWHRGFWFLSVANLLLVMAVYALIPVLPLWLRSTERFSDLDIGLSMGIFAVGLFGLGSLCSYLVQRYRRNLVCMWAIAIVAVCLGAVYYVEHNSIVGLDVWIAVVQRFLLGAFFGLAQMVLFSTLIIDNSESKHRTEANHLSSWISRLAMALGPLCGIVVYGSLGFAAVLVMCVLFCLVAIMLIKLVKFPFRAPSETMHLFSLDRFFLPQGFILFLNIMMYTFVLGLLFTLPLDVEFFGMMMVGFVLAFLSQRFVFQNAELKSETVTGLILLIAALVIMLTRPHHDVRMIAPVMIGLATGLVGSRFMLFFIKLSGHCQRGTSSSTFVLGWETGLALGLGCGFTFFGHAATSSLAVGIVVSAAALALYLGYTHKWFVQHKNR